MLARHEPSLGDTIRMASKDAGAPQDRLREKIASTDAIIGVVGLGYVGLPLALAYAEKGFKALGFDVDAKKITDLSAGKSYIGHIGSERVEAARAEGSLSATTDFKRLGEADVVFICVPTPLTAQREPDLSYVVKTTQLVRETLRPGQLIVLESTTYPETTDVLLLRELEQTGLRCGQDFFLAFSPEREDPGNASFTTTTIPKVVGGVDEISGDLAQAAYSCVMERTVRVSSARAAEATKLTENIFRAVNIALVNELKVIYDRLGIDVWEVIDAAATKPFGFMRFNPGPGWGGHCIPLDPFYLTWKAREVGVDTKFIELAGEVNRSMPDYVVGKLRDGLNRERKALNGSRVLVLGLAYKKNIGDTRETPAFQVMQRLIEYGAELDYHDPFVDVAPITRQWPDIPEKRSIQLTPENLGSYDAVAIITDHDNVDYELVAKHAKLIVDSRGVYRTPRANVIKA